MTLFLHELKRNKWSLLIWTAAISFMLGVCVLIYPEMEPQMSEMTNMFADMGSFTAAFGMDQLNFGEFTGFFAIECGNVLGLGGALFAGVLGITALAKEEKDHTAEFLLTHPVDRSEIVDQKLLSVLAQITLLNVVVLGVTLAGILAIGEQAAISSLMPMFLAYYLLQLEIGILTFGISAFLTKGGFGIGLGISFGFYFMNIFANLTKDVAFLKYLTPFSYCDGGFIVREQTLQWKYVAVGVLFAAVSLVAAFRYYPRKDVQA